MKKDSASERFLDSRRRLGDALRALCAEVVACDAANEVFLEAAEAVEGFVERLRGQPRRTRIVGRSVEEAIRIEGERYHYGDLMDFSPVSGLANPLAPPMTIMKGGESTMVGMVNFSSAYEGGPGLVHGGYIAAVFDEFLGVTQSLTGKAGVTGVLRVRYRSPCPVDTELRIEGQVHRIEGRKITARATMRNGGQLMADGEATFVVSERNQFKEELSDRS